MKLILIPDNPACHFSHATRPRIAISIPGDDYTIHDILEKLVTPALVAMLFHPQTISDGYHDAHVMGAAYPEATPEEPTPDTKNAEAGIDVPPGFTLVGFGVDAGEEVEFPVDDLIFSAGGRHWIPTHLANGYNLWYAARTGSATLAKLQAHVASL